MTARWAPPWPTRSTSRTSLWWPPPEMSAGPANAPTRIPAADPAPARPARLDGRQCGGEPGLVRRLCADRRLGRPRRRRLTVQPGRTVGGRRRAGRRRGVAGSRRRRARRHSSPQPAAKHRSRERATPHPSSPESSPCSASRSPELTARQVMQRIEDTAHRPPAGWDPVVGHGIVDALAAVTGGPGPPAGPGRQYTAAVSMPASEPTDGRPGNLPFEAPRSASHCRPPWWR